MNNEIAFKSQLTTVSVILLVASFFMLQQVVLDDDDDDVFNGEFERNEQQRRVLESLRADYESIRIEKRRGSKVCHIV